jgi:hypothetical protein
MNSVEEGDAPVLAIDLVKTPRKKALLCLVYQGRLGYNFEKHNNWGYHMLPSSFTEIMSQDVFQELIAQLALDRLILQVEQPSEMGLLLFWNTTALGRRLVKILLGEPLPAIKRTIGNINEGEFLVEKFGLHIY